MLSRVAESSSRPHPRVLNEGHPPPTTGRCAAISRVAADRQPLPSKAPTRPQRAGIDPKKLQAVADAAHAAEKPDDYAAASFASMSQQQLADAVDTAVIAGKLSGTDAVALLKRLKSGR